MVARFIAISLSIVLGFASIAHAQTDDWKKPLQERVDVATTAAKVRCGSDVMCNLQIQNALLIRINVVAACVNVEMTAASVGLKTALAEIEGKKIDLEQKKVNDKAVVDARALCDNSQKEVGEKVITALGLIDIKK